MKTPTDIITRLQVIAQEGTKSDRKLAGVVLSDPDFASKAVISEIAGRASISEPTVTRFCRSLGCDGLRDFKFHLAQAIAIGGAYLTAQAGERDAHQKRIASLVGEAATAAILRVTESTDMAAIITVGGRLAEAGNILCIGSGGISSMMATEMQNRLFRLGLAAVSHVDGQLQRMYAAVATGETVVIAFSVSGFAQSVVDAVLLAGQYGAATIAVTEPGSDLARAAGILIPFHPDEDANLYKPTSSRFALLAIVDMIATATAEARGPRALEKLRRIKQSVNMLKVDNPRLPLGD